MVKELRGQIKEANRKPGMHDSHDNPSAQDYNLKRAEFRKKRGTYDRQAGTRRWGTRGSCTAARPTRSRGTGACPLCGSAGSLSAERKAFGGTGRDGRGRGRGAAGAGR